MTDVVVMGFILVTHGIVNSCLSQEALTPDVQRNSQHNYDNNLYKLTSEDASTVYYVLAENSEKPQSALRRVIQSPNRTKVVLCLVLLVENGSIMKDKFKYRKQIDFLNAHLNYSFRTYSMIVLLAKVNTLK